jgi:hypothetical protein
MNPPPLERDVTRTHRRPGETQRKVPRGQWSGTHQVHANTTPPHAQLTKHDTDCLYHPDRPPITPTHKCDPTPRSFRGPTTGDNSNDTQRNGQHLPTARTG